MAGSILHRRVDQFLKDRRIRALLSYASPDLAVAASGSFDGSLRSIAIASPNIRKGLHPTI